MAKKNKYIKAGDKKSPTMICDSAHGLNLPCPKCGKIMQTRTHKQITQKLLAQPYYCMYWCYCVPCRHLQHYENAKIWRN